MHFLIIQTAFIGDAILATAVLEKLHRHYPDSRFDLLVRKGNEGLFRHHPYLNKVYTWDKKRGKYRQMLKLIRQLRQTRYDYIFNFQRFASSGIITVLARAKYKYGFRKNPLSWRFTQSFPHQIGNGMHETERNHQLIEALTDTQPARPRLYPQPVVREQVQQYQAGTYVCIAPASVWYTKQFPGEKWLELIEKLHNQTIYLIGSANDYKFAEHICSQTSHPAVHNLCGRLNLLQTAALMEQASMNYVNDSAPLHIASATNAPVRAVFLSTVPDFGFTPLSDDSKAVEIKEDLYCRPCGLHGYNACPEGHFRCAYDIDVRDFLE